jgi:hypothetical protein
LIKEFDKVLNGKPYSVLPIQRLVESNPAVAHGLAASRESQLGQLIGLSSNMLLRPADKPNINQEVMTRVGLSVETVDGAGQPVLCRPGHEDRAAQNQVSKPRKRKATNGKATNQDGKKALLDLRLFELRELAVAENVVLPEKSRLLKADYADAIYLARTLLTDDNIDDNEEGTMDVVEVEVNEDAQLQEQQLQEQQLQEREATAKKERETVAKQFIYANNTILELIAIIAKEKIKIKTGSKIKIDYVNAIYIHRNPSL